MIAQNKNSYKIARTEEKLTSRSGLVLYGEFLQKAKLYEALQGFPKPLTDQGIECEEYILPLMLMMYGGGHAIAHTREIREDKVLQELLGMESVPSESAIGDWLKKMARRKGIETINHAIGEGNKYILERSSIKEYTLVNDPTILTTTKRDAHMTYLGEKGYRPGLAFVLETNTILHQEFREGNDMGDKLKFLQEAFSKMTPGKKIKNVLLDSEFYMADIINYLEEMGCDWAIAADQNSSVKELIHAIPESDWVDLMSKKDFNTGKKVAETVHCMDKTKKAFRLVVIRWKDKKGNTCYHAIASNKKGTPTQVVWFYNQRCGAEDIIGEVKHEFGLSKLPSGDFQANALYFAIGILTYNYFIAQKLLTMPVSLQNKAIRTIRWFLVNIPGKLIRHANSTILKIAVSIDKFDIFTKIRRRTRCLAVT